MISADQKTYLLSIFNHKSDYVGVTASSLCMFHCLLTPVLFAVQATSLSCSEIGPIWWKAIDYLFLVISFFAMLYTNRVTTSNWIPKAIFTSWAILALFVINNSIQLVSIPHLLIHIPAASLASLHIYNRRYCHCQEDQCCTTIIE
ncbi:MAG: hypothetical protein ACI9FN_002528 [Saprospiraceae bacterium]|jgi:hypothetical protein